MRQHKRWMAAALLVATVWTLAACERLQQGDFDYLQGDFEAEAEGNCQGRSFSCLMVYRGGECREVRYLSPPALEGLTLERSGSQWRMCFAGHQTNFDNPEAFWGLLMPMRFFEAGGDGRLVSTVQKTADGRLFQVQAGGDLGELTIAADANGNPVTVSGAGTVIRVRIRRSAEDEASQL